VGASEVIDLGDPRVIGYHQNDHTLSLEVPILDVSEVAQKRPEMQCIVMGLE